MDLFRELLQTATDPRLRHVAIVHVPIGLSVFAPLAALCLVAFKEHRRTLRWVALIIFAAVSASAFVAARAGAEAIPRFGMLTGDARSTISTHAAIGDWVWVLASAGLAGSGLAFSRKEAVARAARWGTLVVAVACAGVVGLVGHLGGTFVHVHLPQVADAETKRIQEQLNAATSALQAAATAQDAKVVHFKERVEPVFVKSCIWCHTPADGNAPAGGLDLTTREGLLKGGQGGPVVVLGKPEESVLYQAVARTHPVLKMPKRASKLPDDQIEAIAQWIRDGCVWTNPQSPSP